ncbi:MAG: DUF4388 domain-containing protein [Deltaproteobacteria bacterium]|nr:DUF4388 domain-containing protein [Deltaproteobacteria bacterium]
MSETHVMEGDLRHVRLPSLLQLAEAELYTGRITLTPGGSVTLHDGAVVAAATDHGLVGLGGLMELFLASEGRFVVTLDPTIVGAPLAPTIAIIMDGCKLIDEWTQLASERYTAGPDAARAHGGDAERLARVRPVLAAMARGATVAAAVASAGVSRASVVPDLLALVEAGLIVPPDVLAPPPTDTSAPIAPTALLTDDDIDELASRGRAHIRSGDLDSAEQLLRMALERRPNDRVLAQNLRLIALRRAQGT